MEQWEYLTMFVQANAGRGPIREYVQKRFNRKPRRHSPESMIPQLDTLGAQGWELVHMQPVARVGRNEDVQLNTDDWSSQYFCVFKRRKAGSHVPISVVAAQPPTGSA